MRFHEKYAKVSKRSLEEFTKESIYAFSVVLLFLA